MSLTDDDLKAIKNIVDTSVDKAIDKLAVQTAGGFSEVDQRFAQIDQRFVQVDQRFAQVDQRFQETNERIENLSADLADVKATVGRIENVQRAEVERMDSAQSDIQNIKLKLNMA